MKDARDVLPITKEKYIFRKHVDSTKDKTENNSQRNDVKLRFIDSFKFFSTSLDKLASYLDKDKLKIIQDVQNFQRYRMMNLNY